MISALVLLLYLCDQLLSVFLPFSSGAFTFAIIAIFITRVTIKHRTLTTVVIASAVAIGFGFLGAGLSGTPVTLFFVSTVVVLACMWTVGAGLRGYDSLLITCRGAFVGVLVSSGFLLLAVLGWDAMSFFQGAPTNRPSGLYGEPSHYALFVMPLWLIAYQHRQYRAWLYVALAFSLVTCFSATLAAFLIFALVLTTYQSTAHANLSLYKVTRLLIAGSTLAILAYFLSDLLFLDGVSIRDYVGSRLYTLIRPDDDDAFNLSSLVLLQGIELAKLSFSHSLGMGVGLGNFGTSTLVLDQSAYRSLINTIMNGSDLSLRDGGLLASKLVGELGVFALPIALLLVRHFRRLNATLDAKLLGYHGAFSVALLCALFIRALPYFSAPVCLAVFSMAGLLNSRALATRRRIEIAKTVIDKSGSEGINFEK